MGLLAVTAGVGGASSSEASCTSLMGHTRRLGWIRLLVPHRPEEPDRPWEMETRTLRSVEVVQHRDYQVDHDQCHQERH